MSDPVAYLQYRIRILPNQLAAARARVAQLEREAIRYGFMDMLAEAPDAGRYDPASIVDSDAVIGTYAAPEWRELDENGHDWVAAIARETLARAGRTDLPPSSGLPPLGRNGAVRDCPTHGAIGGGR
jgi:hypothetical protein